MRRLLFGIESLDDGKEREAKARGTDGNDDATNKTKAN
jgi:hypothetical protein